MGRSSAKNRLSEFARNSRDRLSGRRRLISPIPDRKLPPVNAAPSSAMVIEMVDQAPAASKLLGKPHPPVDLNSSFTSATSCAEDNCCVLMVGSTGTGKSATIAKLTGQKVKSSDSLRGVTKKCDIYRPAKNSSESIFPETRNLFFVDTVGWEDPDGVDDDETFKDILRFIDNNNIANLKAVIWTVNTNVRQDAQLNRQATLIDKFGSGCKSGSVWDRVIIACKQSANVEADTRGAFAAALDFNPRAAVQRLGHRFMDDSSLSMDQQISCESDVKSRQTWNVKTDDEVRQSFRAAFDQIEEASQPWLKVVFNDKRCADCGAIGDPRLLSKFCHMKKSLVHKIPDPEPVHPMPLVSYHPEDIPFKTHPGYLHRAPWYKDIRRKRVYTCCSGKLTSSGCCFKWRCCGQTHKIATSDSAPIPTPGGCRKKYTCCGVDEETAGPGCENLFPCCGRNRNQEGCTQVCLKCEKPWGTPADKCYVKPHTVREVDDPLFEKRTDVVKTGTSGTLAKMENGLVLPNRLSLLERCELPKGRPLLII